MGEGEGKWGLRKKVVDLAGGIKGVEDGKGEIGRARGAGGKCRYMQNTFRQPICMGGYGQIVEYINCFVSCLRGIISRKF